MDPIIIRYWGQARGLLLQFRAGAFKGDSLDLLHKELLAEAAQVDTNRRTSPYNLVSPYQDQMNLIMGQTLKLAEKWLRDGKPAVPAV